MQKVVDLLGDVVILPSSIHEVLVISKQSEMASDLKMLKETVMAVNGDEDCIPPEDILSNNIYEYTREGGLNVLETTSRVAVA